MQLEELMRRGECINMAEGGSSDKPRWSINDFEKDLEKSGANIFGEDPFDPMIALHTPSQLEFLRELQGTGKVDSVYNLRGEDIKRCLRDYDLLPLTSATNVIRFGLPSGNLNKPAENCGWMWLMLKLAGFPVKEKDYSPGSTKEIIRIPGDCRIAFFPMRAKYLIPMLQIGALDIAAFGKDSLEEYIAAEWQDNKWVNNLRGINKRGSYVPNTCIRQSFIRSLLGGSSERMGAILHAKDFVDFLEHTPRHLDKRAEEAGKFQNYLSSYVMELSKERLYGDPAQLQNRRQTFFDLCNLDMGFVKVRWIADMISSGHFSGGAIRIFTAYPNMTYREITRHVGKDYIHMRNRFVSEDEDNRPGHVNVYPLASKTEPQARYGGPADIICDNESTGGTIERNHLSALGRPIATSSAHLFANNRVGNWYIKYKRMKQGLEEGPAYKCEFDRRVIERMSVIEEIVERFVGKDGESGAKKEYAKQRGVINGGVH